jgi:hypothetical protein
MNLVSNELMFAVWKSIQARLDSMDKTLRILLTDKFACEKISTTFIATAVDIGDGEDDEGCGYDLKQAVFGVRKRGR